MTDESYNELVFEIFEYIDKDLLVDMDMISKPSERADRAQDALRVAIGKSSIGMFNGQPYCFTGRIYEPMTWDDFGNVVYDVLMKCNIKGGDMQRLENIIRVCRRKVAGKKYRQDNAVVVMGNGVFNFHTGKLCDFSREFMQTTKVDYHYNPKDHPVLWKRFLDRVLPDAEMQKVLQEFLGSVFVDRTEAKMETMLILLGSGSNGKSVVFETVMGILGRENVSNFSFSELIAGVDRKKNIATINGKRLNYSSEVDAFKIDKGSDLLKALISGEPMEARPIYGDNFTAYNLPLIMSNANTLPDLRDCGYGMRRRITVLPFNVEIPVKEQNRTLARDLEVEYPAIFNWIMAGRKRFVENGYKFTASDRLEAILDDYQSDNSSVLKFMIRSGLMRRPEDGSSLTTEPQWVRADRLYKVYSAWAHGANDEPETKQYFGKTLFAAGYLRKRTQTGIHYGLYGQRVIEIFGHAHAAEERPKKKTKKSNAKIITVDGRGYVYTLTGLANYLGITKERVTAWYHAEVFDGMYMKQGRLLAFDIEKVISCLKQRGIFMSDDEKLSLRKQNQALVEMRKKFNATMKRRGMPFRKYQGNDNVTWNEIVVPDEWEYSDTAARELYILNKDKLKKVLHGEENAKPIG